MKKTFLLSVLLAAAIAGCSGSSKSVQPGTDENKGQPEPETKPAVSADPVTISILNWNAMTDEEFERYFVKPVSSKHPNITLKLVKKNSGTPQDAIANHLMSGEFPDLVFVSNKDINQFLLQETIYSLDEMVKTNGFDLKRFEPSAVESLQKKGKGLVSIPWAQNVAGLFYSLDVFDKFGVPYPKDLMTWEEALDLAKTLTRKDGDTQYIGLNMSSLSQFAQSLSVSYVSPEGKALVDTPTWKRILEFYRTLYSIPGYAEVKGSLFGAKNAAMLPEWVSAIMNNAVKDPDFRWNVAGLPNFAELLGTGREIDAHTLAISASSKHKEQAFQVIQAVTTNEVQAEMSKFGRVPILADQKVLADFGSEVPVFKGKNWDAMFKVKPAKLRENATIYDSTVLNLINPLAERIRKGETDINTLLRETQEKADAALAEAMR